MPSGPSQVPKPGSLVQASRLFHQPASGPLSSPGWQPSSHSYWDNVFLFYYPFHQVGYCLGVWCGPDGKGWMGKGAEEMRKAGGGKNWSRALED